MTVGNSSHEAAEEQQRRERMRDEYDSGLDRVPSQREERRMRELGIEPDDEQVQAAGYGAAGIMGDLL